MANYVIKYRVGSEIASELVSASDEETAGTSFAASHPTVPDTDVINVELLARHYRSYGAATFVAELISFCGWIVLILGVVGVAVGVAGAQGLTSEHGPEQQLVRAAAYAVSMFSLLFALMGLLMAAMGQQLRATTDAAKHLGRILERMTSGVVTTRQGTPKASLSPERDPAPAPTPASPPESAPTPTPPPTLQRLSTPRFCSVCGATVGEGGSAFCAQCGNKL
jgi:hypothetical protein